MPTNTPPEPGAAPKPFRSRLHAHLYRQFSAVGQDLWFIAFALVLAVVLFVPSLIQTIPAGHVGVVYKRFGGGTDLRSVLSEGVVLVLPWNTVTLYDARVLVTERRLGAMTADGLKVELDVVWRYHLNAPQAGLVHKAFGPDYGSLIIDNTVSHVLRDVVAHFATQDLYSSARTQLGETVFMGAQKALENLDGIATVREEAVGRGVLRALTPAVGKRLAEVEWVLLEDVLVKHVHIPKGLEDAITRKNEARTLVEEFEYRLQAEQKEVERKRIEALGIRNFQEIVSAGLSDSYLAWKGIGATLELAKSPNAKVVVIGSGRNGLPIILNTEGGVSAGSTPPNMPSISPEVPPAARPAAAGQ